MILRQTMACNGVLTLSPCLFREKVPSNLLLPPPTVNSCFWNFWHMAASNKYMFTFLKLLQLIKCCHNWFLKKLKQCVKETHFYHHTFLFVMWWLAFHQHYAKNFKTFQKKMFQLPGRMRKNFRPRISAEGYQWKHEMQVDSK